MIDIEEFFSALSLISLVLYFVEGLKKNSFMALALVSPTTPSSSSNLHKRLGSFSSENLKKRVCGSEEKNVIFEAHESIDLLPLEKVEEVKRVSKLRNKPMMKLVVPVYNPALEFGEMGKEFENREFEVEGRGYFLASKKGKREVMEDNYGAMLDIFGDPKQAFFAVIDGHGGRAAADYVAEHLGGNIVKELARLGKKPGKDQLEAVLRGGYSVTDKEFLVQGVSGGACAASVLLKNGELHVANVGDCRVVLSRNGSAVTLTNDHRLSREDERSRIQNSGGYIHCRNGIWRVNGSLAVSRAIGDQHLKEWIISEPEINSVSITSDCQFLILASDGLWDKVNDQEAVDVVLKHHISVESCKKLVDKSFIRGNKDDITVMVINLQKFIPDRIDDHL